VAWSVLQSKEADTGGSALSSLTVTFTTANVTAGSKIIVAVACASSPAITCTGVADAASNAWTLIKRQALPAFGETSLWALDVPAGDAGTKPALTATLSGTGGAVMIAQEVSGLLAGNTAAMCDGTPVSASGTGGTSTGSPAYSTAAANEYLVSIYGDDGSGATWTVPAGYTGDANGVNASTIDDLQIASKNSTGGSEASSYGITSSGQGWGQIVVAFQLATGGGGASPGATAPRQVFSRNWRHRHRRLQQIAGAPPPAQPSSGASLAVTASARATATPQFLTSTAGSGQALYFADQSGAPYLLRWDTAWAVITNAGQNGGATTFQSDMDAYTATRAAQGFNGFLATPVGTAGSGSPNDSGETWDGVFPFSSPGVLNSTFWARVDYLISSAAANGLTVVLNAMYTYALFNTGGSLHGWTATQCQSYGAAAGARYASTPNLIWEVGDDYNGSWVGGAGAFDAQFSGFLTGLRGASANQLISVENMSGGASRYACRGPSDASYAWGIAHAQFNWIYDYSTTYNAVEDAYTEAAANSVPSLVNVRMDGWYDNEATALTESEELFGRKSYWWALSSGSRGYMYGAQDVWNFAANALTRASSPGAGYMQPSAIKTILDTFAGIPGWHLLVPDTSSALVTAGRGTRSADLFAGVGAPTSGAQYEGGDTYVTASRTPDGGSGSALAVIYIPAHATITIDQTKMAAGYTATWVDPASGATSSATVGSTYNSTAQGSNSAADPDWLLVLQAPPVSAFTGTASLAVTASLTAAGTVAAASGASLTATVTLTATGNVATVSAASFAVTATLAAAGGTAGAAGLPVTVTPAAAGNVATASGASLAATVSLTATPAGGAASAAALAVTAALSATGTATGTAPLAVAAALAAAGSSTLSSGAALVVTAALAATGSVAEASGAPLTITAALSASGGATGSASLAVAAALTAAGSGTLSSGAALAIAVTTAAAGTADDTTSLAVAVALAASGTVATASGAPLAVAVSLTATPAGSIASGAALAVSMTAASAGTDSGTAGLPVTVTLAAAGSVTAGASGGATLAAAVTLAAAGNVATSSGAILSLAITAVATTDATTGTAYGTARAGQMTVPRAVAGQWN
jgi:hypothetical protein